MVPIAWMSKKQAAVEASVFGAEHVAMKIGTEHIRSLRCKLHTMGVLMNDPAHICSVNMSVIHNTQHPESAFEKKSHSICCHCVREAAAMGEFLAGHISAHMNHSDLAAKLIPGGQKCNHLVSMILCDVADQH